jgi:hypothetical protein
MENVSHAEFQNSAAFATMPAAIPPEGASWNQEGASYGQEAIPPAGASWNQEGRMEEWSREILRMLFCGS